MIATQKTIRWVIKRTTYECVVLDTKCQFCGKVTLTGMPEPLVNEQTDGTNVVCHPSLGGCNHGFESGVPLSMLSRKAAK